MIFSYLLTFFALLAWRKTWQQYRQERVSKTWFALATGLWLMVVVVSWVPDWTDRVAARLGVGRGSDLIVYSAVVILTYAVLRLIARQQELTRELTNLTRAIALKNPTLPPSTPNTPV